VGNSKDGGGVRVGVNDYLLSFMKKNLQLIFKDLIIGAWGVSILAE